MFERFVWYNLDQYHPGFDAVFFIAPIVLTIVLYIEKTTTKRNLLLNVAFCSKSNLEKIFTVGVKIVFKALDLEHNKEVGQKDGFVEGKRSYDRPSYLGK